MGREKDQDDNAGESEVNKFVAEGEHGTFYPFAHAGANIPMGDGILEVVRE